MNIDKNSPRYSVKNDIIHIDLTEPFNGWQITPQYMPCEDRGMNIGLAKTYGEVYKTQSLIINNIVEPNIVE